MFKGKFDISRVVRHKRRDSSRGTPFSIFATNVIKLDIGQFWRFLNNLKLTKGLKSN